MILNKEAKEKMLSLLADVASTVVGVFFWCDKWSLDDKLKMDVIKNCDIGRIKVWKENS